MVTTLKYCLGEYELDPSAYSLSRASTPVPVSRKRFEVLLYLVREQRLVVTRRELVERFWDGLEVYEENLTKCVSEHISFIKRAGTFGTSAPKTDW